MILNIENYTIKIDHEARTVEVSQKTLNAETETLMEAVKRVSQPTLEDYEEMSQHFETGPQFEPSNHPDHSTPTVCPVSNCRNDAVIDPQGIVLQCGDCFNAMYGRMGRIVATRKPRAIETEPRAPCRSTCCGTLNRRTRDGSCAGCRGLSDEDREALSATNHSLLYAIGVSL